MVSMGLYSGYFGFMCIMVHKTQVRSPSTPGGSANGALPAQSSPSSCRHASAENRDFRVALDDSGQPWNRPVSLLQRQEFTTFFNCKDTIME